MTQLEQSYSKFLTEFLRYEMKKQDTDGNLVFSPFSLLVLLCMVAESAKGETKEEITKFLAGTDWDGFEKALLVAQGQMAKSESLAPANAVLADAVMDGNLTEGYPDRMRDLFDAETFISTGMLDAVNSWVNEKTHGMIPKLLDSADGQVYLVNAIAFESEWELPYDEWTVKSGKFHNANGKKAKVKMLNSTEHTVVEDERFLGFVKSYKDRAFSYMALLPKKPGTLDESILETDLVELYKANQYEHVDVKMPEFQCDFSEPDVAEFCKAQGVEQVFTPSADLSPLTPITPTYVNRILHKAHIEVSRTGTRAAAVSAAEVMVGCAMPMAPPREIILNRPFAYAIVHRETGLPVFVGTVQNL